MSWQWERIWREERQEIKHDTEPPRKWKKTASKWNLSSFSKLAFLQSPALIQPPLEQCASLMRTTCHSDTLGGDWPEWLRAWEAQLVKTAEEHRLHRWVDQSRGWWKSKLWKGGERLLSHSQNSEKSRKEGEEEWRYSKKLRLWRGKCKGSFSSGESLELPYRNMVRNGLDEWKIAEQDWRPMNAG